MELCLDTETPEKRVLSWLSQTDMPASIRNNCEVSATLNERNKNNCAKIKNVSNSVHCCVRQLPKRYQKSGLNKYFSINYENNDESASSDSERELQEHSRSNRLYCDAERNLIIRYIVEKKLFPFLKGNTMWKQMEKERICCRTWQSMKTQFHKYIYPHLDDFDISDTDRSNFALSMTRSSFKKSVSFLSPGQRGWRKNCKFYTFIEDAIILYYILEKDRYEFANGNTLWQRMESKHVVPGRSWHSMKSRYKNFLSKYIERVNSPIKNGNMSQKKKLGAVEKTKLLQDFMVDHLNDVAATIGCITNSNENLEEIRCLRIDSSFSIPLPENDTNFSEREVIKKCVWDIAQQLDEKFQVLIEYSNKTAMKCKEIINVFSPKYSESFQCRDQSLCTPDCNYDLSESVQRGLKISSPKQCVRNLFGSSPAKSSNKPCTVVNPERSDTFDRINFSENVVFERILHLTEKVQVGVKDCPYNAEENLSNFLLHNYSLPKGDVHFSNTQKKTSAISQTTGNADEETTEILNSPQTRDENPLGNTLQENYMTSDTTRCESRYSNGGKEMQPNNQNSSSTYNVQMPESFSTVNSCAVQSDEFKLPELTLPSADHFFSNSKSEDTKEINKSCNTLNKCSNVCDMSNVKLRPSSAITLDKILAPEIQRESNNNKQNNLHRNSLIFETIQKKAECSDAKNKLCSSEMHTYSVSLNIPQNTFTKKPLDINVQSDHALKNSRYYMSEESNTLDSTGGSKSDSGKRVRVSDEFDNDKFATCSIACVDYVGQNSKVLMVDDNCRLESSNLNSCYIFTREHQSNNNHAQSHDRLEVDPEPRLHLTEEEELEPDLRLHLSEDDSEEEPELHLHISEDESEGEHELKLRLTENETGKIQDTPHSSTVSTLQNF